MWIVELNCDKKVLSEVIHGDETYAIGYMSSRGDVVIPARTIKDSRRIKILLYKYLFACRWARII
jgi:hypothetical protein